MIDPQKFGSELADIVKMATAPLLARIEMLEGQLKAVEGRPVGLEAKDVQDYLAALELRVEVVAGNVVQKALEAIPPSVEPPAPPELPDIPALVAKAVQEAVKAIPAPQDGAPGEKGDPGRDGRRCAN